MFEKITLNIVVALLVVMLSACSSGEVRPAQPAPTAPPAAAPAAATTPTPKPAVPDNIPIMPGATDLNVTESDISYIIKADLPKVIEFYSKEMVAKGWREQEKSSITGTFGRMYFATQTQQASFFLIYSEPLNQVSLRMTIVGLNVAIPTIKP